MGYSKTLSAKRQVVNCYNTGNVNGAGSSRGGLIGKGETLAQNSYYYQEAYSYSTMLESGSLTAESSYSTSDYFTSPSSTVTYKATASSTSEELTLVEALNKGAESYNATNPTIKAKAWKSVSGGYPVLALTSVETYSVTFTLDGLTASGANEATGGSDYTTILSAASTGRTLPSSITVTVGGTELTLGSGYSYSTNTGEVKIPAENVTGDIVITATAGKLTGEGSDGKYYLDGVEHTHDFSGETGICACELYSNDGGTTIFSPLSADGLQTLLNSNSSYIPNGNYYLTENVTLSQVVKINNGAAVKLALNGKVYDLKGKYITVESGGSLTVLDKNRAGLITTTNSYYCIVNKGTLTVDGARVTGSTSYKSGTVGVIVNDDGATATITNSTVTNESAWYAVNNISGAKLLSIGDSTVVSEYCGIYHQSNSTSMYLYGDSVINGKECDIYLKYSIWAISKDGTQSYTGDDTITIKFEDTVSDGKYIVCNVTEDNKGKFLPMFDEDDLKNIDEAIVTKEGRDAYGDVLMAHKHNYNNGVCASCQKKFTGLDGGKYYVNGELANSVIDGKYYKDGELGTGVYDGKLYENGVLFSGVYNNRYYENGELATGTSGGIYYVDGNPANGKYNDNDYVNGKEVYTVDISMVTGVTYDTAKGSLNQTKTGANGTAFSAIVLKADSGYSQMTEAQATAINNSLSDTGLTATYADGDVTISGTPTKNVSLKLADILTGSVAPTRAGYQINLTTPAGVTVSGNLSQTIVEGAAIENIVLTAGDYADLTAEQATAINTQLTSAGLTAAFDETAKTITISGTPTMSSTFDLSEYLTVTAAQAKVTDGDGNVIGKYATVGEALSATASGTITATGNSLTAVSGGTLKAGVTLVTDAGTFTAVTDATIDMTSSGAVTLVKGKGRTSGNMTAKIGEKTYEFTKESVNGSYIVDATNGTLTVEDGVTVTDKKGIKYTGKGTFTFTADGVTVGSGATLTDTSGNTFKAVDGEATVSFDNKLGTVVTGGKFEISGKLPSGVTVTYTNNGKTESGVYTVIAKFSGDSANYDTIANMTATLTIKQATIEKVVDSGDENKPDVVVSEEGGIDPDVQLVVVKQDEIPTAIKENAKRNEIVYAVYDITLHSDGVSIQPSGELTIKLLIPDDAKGRTFRILHLHGDEVTEVEYTVDGDYAVFTVDKLSEFSIVVDNTGSAWWLIILLAIIIVIEIILIACKKRKTKSKSKKLYAAAGLFGGVIPVAQIVLLAVLGSAAVILGVYTVCLYFPRKKAVKTNI